MSKRFSQKSQRLKEYKRLEKEYNSLWKIKCNLGWYKLEKPIRHGWYKQLTLRTDISRRKDAWIFEEVISNAGMIAWGRDKKMADKIWVKKLRKSECRIFDYPGMKRILRKDYQKLKPKVQACFIPVPKNIGNYYTGDYISILPSWYFETYYEKAFITHRRILDPELDSRMDELENMFESNKYYNFRMIGNRYWYCNRCRKIERKRVKMALANYDKESYDSMMGKSIPYW
jgi:hypothetical protein